MSHKYNDDFKREIVHLRKSGKSVSELCREYGLGKNTITQWMKLFDGANFVRKKKELSKEQQELISIRKALSEQEKQITIMQHALSVLLKKKP